MLTYVVISTWLTCLPPIIEVYKGLTWGNEDARVLEMAKDGCKRYYGRASCLKVFRKIEEKSYHVICSKSHHSASIMDRCLSNS